MKSLCILLIVLFSVLGFSQNRIHSGEHDHRTCGTMEVLHQKMDESQNYKTSYLRTLNLINQTIEQRLRRPENLLNGNIVTIPVVFHVVHNGEAIGTGANLAEDLIMAQLDQINLDYRALNPDVSNVSAEFAGTVDDLEIEFCLAVRDPNDQETTGILRYDYNQSTYSQNDFENTIKPATIWDRDSYLNIWTGALTGGLLGYAQFPGGTANTDGVVVLNTSVGSVANPNPNGGNYALGRTLTHEIGHWVSLYHIWGDDGTACTGSDQVADTPNQGGSYGGTPTYPQNSCGSNDMFMNYMDYVFDSAMYMFTDGQRQRTDAVLNSSRASLLNSLGCVPIDGFEISSSNHVADVCNGDSVDFTIDLAFNGSFSSTVNFSQTGVPIGTSASFSPTSLNAAGSTTLTINNISATAGQYTITVTATDGTLTETLDVTLNITESVATNPQLISPNDVAINVDSPITFNWSSVPNATSYTFEIATDIAFSNIVSSQSVNSNSLILNLSNETTYYWRVKALNSCSESAFSSIFSFTTSAQPNCSDEIVDGSFEASTSPNANWSESSTQGESLISATNPNTGANAAWLGGTNSEVSIIWQRVTIPTNPALAKYRYFYRIASSESGCTYDDAGVAIDDDLDGTFTIGMQSYDLCATTDTGNAYAEACFDLMAYAGQTIDIGFYARTDISNISSFLVDDVEFIICNDAIQNIPTDTAEHIADYEITTADGWTHYIEDNGTPCDYLDDLRLLSVKKDGQNIGSLGDTGFEIKLTTNPTSTAISAPYNDNATDYYAMNRFWQLTPVNEPTAAVEVKHYYTQQDFDAISAQFPGGISNHTELTTWKINDNPTVWDSNPVNGHTGIMSATTNDGDGLWQFENGTSSTTEFSYSQFPGLSSGPYHAVTNYVGHFGGGGVAFGNSVYQISGNVFYDVDKLSDNLVDGSNFTPIPTLFAVLVDASGEVIVVDELPLRREVGEGTFEFTDIKGGSYQVILRTTAPAIGDTITEASVPLSYFYTGENIGAGLGSDGVVDGESQIFNLNSDLPEINFGLIYFRPVTVP